MYEYLKNNLNKKVIFKLNVKDFVFENIKMMDTHLGIALYEVKSLVINSCFQHHKR